MVVLDDRPGAVRNVVKRLGLQYTVLSDPRAVIADQFNVADDREIEPSWFVVDQRGRVRGLSRGALALQLHPDRARAHSRFRCRDRSSRLFPLGRAKSDHGVRADVDFSPTMVKRTRSTMLWG